MNMNLVKEIVQVMEAEQDLVKFIPLHFVKLFLTV